MSIAKRSIPKIVDIQLPVGRKVFTMKEMFRFYNLLYPESDMRSLMYNEILSRYNKRAIEKKLFQGERVVLGSGLGSLRIKKVYRNFKRPRIDWNQTMQIKKETGKAKYVYFTDDYWFRFSWHKGVKLKNRSVYKFTPTKGVNGITKRFNKSLKEDEFLYEKIKE